MVSLEMTNLDKRERAQCYEAGFETVEDLITELINDDFLPIPRKSVLSALEPYKYLVGEIYLRMVGK
jgi:hypothetical protein